MRRTIQELRTLKEEVAELKQTKTDDYSFTFRK